jgi:Flp pilus assembly protein TadD
MRKALWSAILILAVTCVTLARNTVWSDDISLWQDAVLKSPNKAGTYYSLGSAYAKAGRYEEAFTSMRKSIQLDGGAQFNAWFEDRSAERASQRNP